MAVLRLVSIVSIGSLPYCYSMQLWNDRIVSETRHSLPGDKIAEAVLALGREVHHLAQSIESSGLKLPSGLATKQDLKELKKAIMSKISEFGEVQKAFNVRLATAIDGVTADIQVLNDLIVQLQNTAGEVTPEDQAILDELTAAAAAAVARAEALDALTPPAVPTA